MLGHVRILITEWSSQREWTHVIPAPGQTTDSEYCCCFTKLCLTLCDPMDCSLPGSSVHGIFQARILEWGAIPFSRGSSGPGDQTAVSCIGRWILYHWATFEAYLPNLEGWTADPHRSWLLHVITERSHHHLPLCAQPLPDSHPLNSSSPCLWEDFTCTWRFIFASKIEDHFLTSVPSGDLGSLSPTLRLMMAVWLRLWDPIYPWTYLG